MLSNFYTFIHTSLQSACANPSSCRASTSDQLSIYANLLFSSLSLSGILWKHAFCCLLSTSYGGQGKGLFVMDLLLVGLAALPVSSTQGLLCGWVLLKHFQRPTLEYSGSLSSSCELSQGPMAMAQAEVTWSP